MDVNGINDTLYKTFSPVLDAIQAQPIAALLIAAGVNLLLLVLILMAFARLTKLSRTQARLMRGADGQNIERLIMEHIDRSEQMQSDLARAEEAGNANTRTIQNCLQRVGVVRYNAFDNVGGDQSFSVALLDLEGNGLVLTGLYSRQDMRVYGKPVTRGTSPLALSDEERQAIASARTGGGATSPAEDSGGGGTPRSFPRRGQKQVNSGAAA